MRKAKDAAASACAAAVLASAISIRSTGFGAVLGGCVCSRAQQVLCVA